MARSMQEINRRIRGVKSTMQITRAMEMVSSVKLRRSREVLESSRPYYNKVLENIQKILAYHMKGVDHPLLREREIKTSLYIVLTSDRGLAGGYNSNINKLAMEDIKKHNRDVRLITVGSKAYEFFRARNMDIEESYFGISEEPDFSDAKEIGELALKLYAEKEVDEIKIVYTSFESIISQKPEILCLLPSEKVYEAPEEEANVLMEFEPSAERVLDYLIPKYLESTIFGALIEASASEQGARQVAMESATDNAEDLIDELQLTYNRARQEAITMEISEIVSGAEALE